jgi:hypothetical protein
MSSSSSSRNSLVLLSEPTAKFQPVQAKHAALEPIVNKSHEEQSTLNKFIKSTNKSKSRTATVVTSLRKSIRRKEKSKKLSQSEDERLAASVAQSVPADSELNQQAKLVDSEYFLPKIEFVHEHYDNEPSSESSHSDEYYESEMNNLSITRPSNQNKTNNLSGDSLLNVPSDDEQHLIERLSTQKETDIVDTANSSSELIKCQQESTQQAATQTVSKRERKDSGVGGSLTRQNR